MQAPFRKDVKMSCPLSPTLSGLFADGLQSFELHCWPDQDRGLQGGKVVSNLGYADNFVL